VADHEFDKMTNKLSARQLTNQLSLDERRWQLWLFYVFKLHVTRT